jgi:multidrug efflux system membrane fusion protein
MNLHFPEPFQSVPLAMQSFPHRIRQASPRTRRIAAVGLAALAAIILWALWGQFFPAAPKKAPPPPVKIGTATQHDVAVIEHTIGNVMAYSTVQLTAQVSGKLLSAPFTEGQIVHAGPLLFQIDPRPFQAALEQARAQLAKDQAQLVSLRNDEKRFVALAAQGAASTQQRDQAVAAAKGAAASVESDKAAVDTARLNLGYTQIRSPINGKTGPILIQPGNLVSANGANPLVVITQIQPIKVSFFLPQKDLPRIQQQMTAGRLEAIIPMPGAASGREQAKVDFVGNAVSAQTGTIELRADFPNTDLKLVPGQLVDVGVTLNLIPNAIVVPSNAVNVGPDQTYVFVVNKQSRAVRVPVTVLYADSTNNAVRGAVKVGDRVVTEGQPRLMNNMLVTVTKGKSTATELAPGAQ